MLDNEIMQHRKVLLSVGHADALADDDKTLDVMTWEELNALRDGYTDAMQAIYDRAENEQRDLTAEEDSCFQFLSKAVKRGVDREMKNRNERGDRSPRQDRPFRQANTPDTWQDQDGNEVHLFKADERLSRRAIPSSAFGHVVKHLATGDHSGIDRLHEMIGASSSLLGGSDPQGGYWVSPELANSIIDTARARSVALRAGVNTVPMNTSEMRMVRVEDDPAIGPVGEGATIESTDVPFGSLRLVAKKLATVIHVSNELLDDASNLSTELDRLLGEAMAGEIDKAILAGDGKKGGIVGILGSNGIQSHTVSSGDLDWIDLLDSLQLLEDENLSDDAALILPPTLLRQLRGTVDSTGQFIQAPIDLADTPRFTSTRLASTSGIHGRFAEVVLGVRSQLSIQVSPHVQFEKDKLTIRARWRGDVGLMRPKALVHLDNS